MVKSDWDLEQKTKHLVGKVVRGTATEADRLAIEANTHKSSVSMRPLPPSAELIKKTRRLLARGY